MPFVISGWGSYAMFLFHGAICALAALFVKMFVPETQGKTQTQLCALYKPAPKKIILPLVISYIGKVCTVKQ